MRLVTWNVLADSYVRPEYYPRTDPKYLRWGARTSAIVDAIERETADVFCLQEVEPRLITHARKRLDGWTIRFASKVNKPDGVALFARPGITIDEVTPLAFSDGSGHVALLATVEGVRIATTHLRWDRPGTPFEERFAVRQVRELGTALHAPAILCGDLNFEPTDLVYEALVGAGYMDPFAATNPPTANPNAKAKRIDYVLHTRELRAQVVEPMAIVDDTALPSDAMPSDHVPLIVELSAL